MPQKINGAEALKCCTIPAIREVRGAYYILNKSLRDFKACYAMQERQLSRYGHGVKRVSTHNGYLPEFSVAVIPYNGRWGSGYILAQHGNGNKVTYTYYIKGVK